MATTTGSATSYHDLLDKLRLYLVANGWTQLAWTAPGSITAQASLQVQGPGSGSGREIYVNIKTVADVATPYYSWRIRGATGYTSGAGEGLNPGELQDEVYFNLWQNSITYWFYVSDRRFIVVAKCSTAYVSLYAGLFLPFGTPTQYPFPLYIGADYSKPVVWSHTNSGRQMVTNPGANLGTGKESSAYYRDQNGIWTAVYNNRYGTSNDQGIGSSDAGARMWPYQPDMNNDPGTAYTSFGSSSLNTGGGRAFDAFVATRQGERPTWPCMIIRGDQSPPGVLDGLLAVPGGGMASEQTLTVGDDTYRAFQNIQRSSGNDFFLVKEA